jgi:hypothetical protein
MLRRFELSLVAAAFSLAGCGTGLPSEGSAGQSNGALETTHRGGADQAERSRKIEHVLLLSLDGFHDFDLTNYVAAHPGSALAGVVARGTRYTNASAQVPSDSFPGTLAMVTGGSPTSTGVYYDVSWDNDLSPAGSDCSTRGALVPFNEGVNFDSNSGSTAADINPAKLPRDPSNGCTPVYPHQYLKVNTIYEVAHAAGLRTAVSDKHPSYEILNGPSGSGIDDFYSPEFNAAKKDIARIMANDELKVIAVLNQIDGYDHAHGASVGVPAIFGMNFQSANIGQKFSGYADPAGAIPQTITTLGAQNGKVPGLAQALDYVDAALGRMVARLDANGLTDSTLLIVTAKHANSPVDRATLRPIDPAGFAPLINITVRAGLVAQVTADTLALIWLKDRDRAAETAAVLAAHSAELGVESIFAGTDIDTTFGGQLAGNPGRRPDVVVQPVPGVVYTTPGAKLCDHAGSHAEDIHVPLVVVDPRKQPGTVDCAVSLRQIAPSILHALKLKTRDLDAVRLENTRKLPQADGDLCDADEDDSADEG